MPALQQVVPTAKLEEDCFTLVFAHIDDLNRDMATSPRSFESMNAGKNIVNTGLRNARTHGSRDTE
jgi:hypothetical protein